ncbi:hypothetical protein ACP70R_000872 [Stipagrostis hirtigluma subsp. patula]
MELLESSTKRSCRNRGRVPWKPRQAQRKPGIGCSGGCRRLGSGGGEAYVARGSGREEGESAAGSPWPPGRSDPRRSRRPHRGLRLCSSGRRWPAWTPCSTPWSPWRRGVGGPWGRKHPHGHRRRSTVAAFGMGGS